MKKKIIIIFLFLMMLLPFRLYHINNPLLDATNFRQAQTATVARNFYFNGINFFKTELDIFGKGKERYLTLEFPVYEATVTVLYKLFDLNVIWGRILSIIAGFIGAWYLYRLVYFHSKNRLISLFSSFFFLFAPLNMYYQRAYIMEPTVITFLLAGIYYFCLWVDKFDKRSYFLSILLLSLGLIQKIVYGPFWYLPMGVYYLNKRKTIKRIITRELILFLIIQLIVVYLWQSHVNAINTINGHQYFTSSDPGQLEWNFGFLKDRFSWIMWKPRLNQVLDGIILKPGLVLLIAGLLTGITVSGAAFLYLWFLSVIIYFLTLFRIQSHDYYQMIMIPPFSVFMAIGTVSIVVGLEKNINKYLTLRSVKKYTAVILFTLICTLFIWRSWLHARWSFYYDPNWYRDLVMAGQSVPPNTWGVLVNNGYDWNSVYTYYTDRKMFLVDAATVTPGDINKWQHEGYRFVMIHDYEKYPELLKKEQFKNSVEILKTHKIVFTSPDFIVYLFN